MKRLLAQTGITYFSVLAVAFYLSKELTVVAVGVVAVLILLFFLIRKLRRTIYLPAMAVVALVALAVNLGYTALYVEPIENSFADGEHRVEATLSDEPYTAYSKYYYRLKTTSIDGEKVSTSLLLKTSQSLDIEIDDSLSFTAELSRVTNNAYRSKGYLLSCQSHNLSYSIYEAESHSLYYYAVELRKNLRKAFDRLLPEDCAALCKAVFIGDKYALDLNVRESFRYSGASYFIVVSGMHFSVLCMLIYGLLRRLKKRWLSLGVTFAFILVYMSVTGFQPSVMRSGVMMSIAVLGEAVRRETYPLNHLGLSGFVLPFIFSPYGAGDIGLILSFYATLSVLLWADPIAKKICFTDEYGVIYRFSFIKTLRPISSAKTLVVSGKHMFLKKLYNMVASLMSVSLAANILVLPISIFAFGGVSLVTLLSSLLLYLPIYLILLFSLFLCLLYQLVPLRFLAVALSYPLFFLCRLVLLLVELLGSLPFSYIRVTSVCYYVWLGVCALLGIWVLLPRNGYRRLPYATFISVILLIAVLLVNTVLSLNTLRLEVYDGDGGVCVGVNSGGSLHLLSLDAKGKALYKTLNSVAERYSGAETVLCNSYDNAEYLASYSNGEFAISDYLLYYSDVGTTADGVILFDENSEVYLDDNLSLRAVKSGKGTVVSLTAGDTEVLIMPSGSSADDVPHQLRSPDILIMSAKTKSAELIDCEKLIFCGSAEEFDENFSDNYNEIIFTDNGDVFEDLR